MTEPTTTRAPAPLEAATVVVLCFGWFILISLSAVGADFPAGEGFSDANLAEMIVTELALGGLALAFLRFRGHSISELLPRPSWAGGIAGVMLFVVTLFAWWFVAGFFDTKSFHSQPIEEMMSKSHVSIGMAVALSMMNGLYEETFLTGYLLEAFRSYGASVAIGLSTLVRLLYHLYQGPIGAASIVVYAVIVSLFYWRTKWLWPVVFCHVLTDLVALS